MGLIRPFKGLIRRLKALIRPLKALKGVPMDEHFEPKKSPPYANPGCWAAQVPAASFSAARLPGAMRSHGAKGSSIRIHKDP